MILLAHSGEGSGWGFFIQPWEFHPILAHFPIAFLLGAVVLDQYASWRNDPALLSTVRGLLIAGVLTGVLAALAGVLAFLTVPAHTEQAHHLMWWHLGIQAAALALFAWPAWSLRRDAAAGTVRAARVAGWVAALLLVVGSGIGGYIVYHGGAGVEPKLLNHELREGHGH